MGLIQTVAHESLHFALGQNEHYIADKGYRPCRPRAQTPTGLGRPTDKNQSALRARHENVNRRLKEFAILNTMFRHDINKHYIVFHAVANLTNMKLKTESPMYDILWVEDEQEYMEMSDETPEL